MGINSIGSQTAIANLDNLSGVNPMQGSYKNHTISLGNTMFAQPPSENYTIPNTPLTDHKVTVPH